jgi:hypothetical protein
MKKILILLASLVVIGTMAGNAQTEKKEPPPPPPPKVDIKKFVPPVIVKNEDLEAFYKRNPSVINFSIKENKVTLKLKDGKKEEYNLKDEEENKRFIEKYGQPPVPPSPPPPKPKSKA